MNAAPSASTGYVGRFAPSPSGPLHAGSLVAALASWLDARAHGGHWLLRMEDVDTPRSLPGAGRLILDQLARCGLLRDAPVLWQSSRSAAYQAALERLLAAGLAYPCACSRADIAAALAAAGRAPSRFGDPVYPGTCRAGVHGQLGRIGQIGRSVRLRTPDAGRDDAVIFWSDRRLGPQQQDLGQAVGDFVLRRADGLWAYQMAVVVDDAAQGVTHVVRGADLADNTARQIHLQRALGLVTPSYLHTPLLLGADGHKLSKQNGAQALALDQPAAVRAALGGATAALGLHGLPASGSVADFLAAAVAAWQGSDGMMTPVCGPTREPTREPTRDPTHDPERDHNTRA